MIAYRKETSVRILCQHIEYLKLMWRSQESSF